MIVLYLIAVLDFTHAHVHKCVYVSLGASKILALHELDFFLYFSSENSILNCVTVSGVTPMGSGWANPRAPGLRGHLKGALSL